MRLCIPPKTKRIKKHQSIVRTLWWLLLGFAIALWLGYQPIANTQPPEALLVLGGAIEREEFAAKFAQVHPELEIWVTGGSNEEYAQWIFLQAGIEPSRVHLDYQAVDTVTNFTTLVDELKSLGVESVYLVTSDDHMLRARAIGSIVLGSRGISFQPLPVPSGRSPEPIEKVIRDGARSILWLTTGYTGSSLGNRKQQS